MNDLVGGRMDLMCDQTTNTANQIKEGQIKPYAVTTRARIAILPEVPTLARKRRQGLRPLGLPRHLGSQGHARADPPEARGRASEGAHRPDCERSLRRPRHRARARRDGDARRPRRALQVRARARASSSPAPPRSDRRFRPDRAGRGPALAPRALCSAGVTVFAASARRSGHIHRSTHQRERNDHAHPSHRGHRRRWYRAGGDRCRSPGSEVCAERDGGFKFEVEHLTGDRITTRSTAS